MRMGSMRLVHVGLSGYLLATMPAHAATVALVHSFIGSPDGAMPSASLTNVDGTLYGITWLGGRTDRRWCRAEGCGTVFSLKP